MIIKGNNYRYDVVAIVKEGKKTNQYALVDNNTDFVLAYGTKKEVASAAKLFSLGGTIALASALGNYYRKYGNR